MQPVVIRKFLCHKMNNSFSAGSLNFILVYLKNKGVETDALCRRLNIDVGLLQDPDARLPLRVIQSVWHAGVEETGDPSLPLYLGKEVNPFALGVVAYMLMHCKTLGLGLQKLCHYQDVLCEGVQTKIVIDGDNAIIELKILDEEQIVYPQYAIESELSVYLTIFKAMLGFDFPVNEVNFTYKATLSTSCYFDVITTNNIIFNSTFNGIAFDKSLLDAPVLNANPDLFPLFEKNVRETFNKLKKSNPWDLR